MLNLCDWPGNEPKGERCLCGRRRQIDAFKADATGALSAYLVRSFPSGSDIFLLSILRTIPVRLRVDPLAASTLLPIDSPGALTEGAGSPVSCNPTIWVGNSSPEHHRGDSTGSFAISHCGHGQIAAFSSSRPAARESRARFAVSRRQHARHHHVVP